jgi:hypothetical protein
LGTRPKIIAVVSKPAGKTKNPKVAPAIKPNFNATAKAATNI